MTDVESGDKSTENTKLLCQVTGGVNAQCSVLPTINAMHPQADSAIYRVHSGAKWNIHALCRYLLNTGFVFVDH